MRAVYPQWSYLGRVAYEWQWDKSIPKIFNKLYYCYDAEMKFHMYKIVSSEICEDGHVISFRDYRTVNDAVLTMLEDSRFIKYVNGPILKNNL